MAKDFFLPLGGGNEIGASSYLLHVGGSNILIDAGIRFRSGRAFPDFGLLIEWTGGMSELDAFLLTHAHLDHCGAITRVYYEAPYVPMFTTSPTAELARVLLEDALRVSQKQRSEDWSVVEASQQLLDEALRSFHKVCFSQPWELGTSGGTAMAIPAGHILGAASFLIELGGKRILITGDICMHPQRTIAGMELEGIPDVDVLIMESTSAYQPKIPTATVEEQHFALSQLVSQIVGQGGRVLIPAFALGRAQEIAAVFRDFFEEGLIEPFPILMDGLVKAICEVYDSERQFLQGRLKTRPGHVIYDRYVRPTDRGFFPSQQVVKALGPTCIIASSGMLLNRTRSAAYARVLLENEQDAVVFSGYLDEESPGRKLRSLRDSQTQSLHLNGRRTKVRAQIERYYLSAHSSSHDLRHLIRLLNPGQVILVHRDDKHDGDADFVDFMLQMSKEGTCFHLSANGIPIYL